MALNPYTTKFSYLDGVYFAINPVFDNYDRPDNQSSRNDSLVDELLSYDFSKARSILDYKHDFTAEATFLYNEHQNRQPKSRRTTESTSISNNLSINSTVASTSPKLTHASIPSLSSSLPLNISLQNTQLAASSAASSAADESQSRTKLISVPTNILASYQNANGLLEPERVSKPRDNVNEINNNNRSSQTSKQNDLLFGFDGSLDPFNDLELKTINEFEELKNILNNTSRPIESPPPAVNSSQNMETSTTNDLDNFGLPKISF